MKLDACSRKTNKHSRMSRENMFAAYFTSRTVKETVLSLHVYKNRL